MLIDADPRSSPGGETIARALGSAGANSRRVDTDQPGPHPSLERLIRGRSGTRYARPVAAHSRSSFKHIDQLLAAHGGPIVLDSGCGTGESSLLLAERFPSALVIGIDKSARRLQRGQAILCARASSKVTLVRADCIDIWRLAREAAWPISRHFLLYPNPWPKHKHLKRRWHAHPVMSDLMSLGGRVELRSNWPIYIREFAAAVKLLTGNTPRWERMEISTPLSPFERKYAMSGHACYRLTVDLSIERC
jgi:tRNA G46 methylase TrmB